MEDLADVARSHYQNDDIEIDTLNGYSDTSVADDGIWVRAFVWVSNEMLGLDLEEEEE